jgi:hypothetical protein
MQDSGMKSFSNTTLCPEQSIPELKKICGQITIIDGIGPGEKRI